MDKTVPKAEGPRPGDSLDLVDGAQVDRGLLLRLTAGEEDHSWNSCRNRPAESSHGGLGDLLGGGPLGAVDARSDHVGLEQGALQEDVVIVESLVSSCQNGFGDLLTSIKIVDSVA